MTYILARQIREGESLESAGGRRAARVVGIATSLSIGDRYAARFVGIATSLSIGDRYAARFVGIATVAIER